MQLSLILFCGFPSLGLGATVLSKQPRSPSSGLLFRTRDVSIAEAPVEGLIGLSHNPKPDYFNSPLRAHFSAREKAKRAETAYELFGTLYSGVYPTANVTWGNKDGVSGQSFISYVNTASANTWTVSSDVQCVNSQTSAPVDKAACGFGAYYNTTLGSFTNITEEYVSIGYFPEYSRFNGSMGYAPITLGGLTVSQQEVALIDYAEWVGDGYSSGALGLGLPGITTARNRTTNEYVHYNPLFTNMVKEGLVSDGIFTVAIDRVPQGTSAFAGAGLIALGGLVPSEYYQRPFISLPIVPKADGNYTYYQANVSFHYGIDAADSNKTTQSFKAAFDTGTAANFIPTDSAQSLNALFQPPAIYNSTLSYWTVDCNATAPYVAYIMGGVEMPMDPRDMIIRSLNGRPGYENVCFSAFADGGPLNTRFPFIIGAAWHKSHVVAYDQTRYMLHFAARQPY